MQINNNISGQEAFALEFENKTLKEKRTSYLVGNTSVFRTNKNIKILIVPGHDDEYWGTENDGIKEVELNRELALKLYDRLKKEAGFSVAIVSDENGYTKTFEKYFDKKEKEIKKFIKKSQKNFQQKIKDGNIQFEDSNYHNKAPEEVAFKLYGINMWANENEFDLVIHVHFNDYAGRYKDKKPKYNGFTLYVPEKQFKNHDVSQEFAQNIFNRLSRISAVSNLDHEKEGIVETQELIAIGSNETLSVPSVLIEYGYIYEPQFTNPDVRPYVISDLADETFLGVKDYFDETVYNFDNFVFSSDLKETENFWTKDNYMLQKELAIKGFYPPQGKTLNDCPIAGYFGECTNKAVKDFQKANNLPNTGFVGPMTREILNSL